MRFLLAGSLFFFLNLALGRAAANPVGASLSLASRSFDTPGQYVGVFTDNKTGYEFELWDHSTSKGGIEKFYANYNNNTDVEKRGWLDNHALNALNTAIGAAIATGIGRLLR